MDARHIPARTELFRYDLAHSHVATVRCRDGFPQDCHFATGDKMGLVLEPSLVWINQREGQDAQVTWVGLDRAISVEFNRGSTQEVRWVRDPNGLWLRLSDQGRY